MSRFGGRSGDNSLPSRTRDLGDSNRTQTRENNPCLGYNSTDHILADRKFKPEYDKIRTNLLRKCNDLVFICHITRNFSSNNPKWHNPRVNPKWHLTRVSPKQQRAHFSILSGTLNSCHPSVTHFLHVSPHSHNLTCVNPKSHHTRFIPGIHLTRVSLGHIVHVSTARHSIHVQAPSDALHVSGLRHGSHM